MRAPCTVRASRPTSQYQDVTCNPGAPSRSGQYLLLRHVHTPDWQTVGLQQKHAALPGFVFPCFFIYISIFTFFSYYFSSCFPKHFLQGQLRPFHKALPCCRCLLAVPGRFFFFGEKNILIYLQCVPFLQTLALLDISALEYIGKIFTLLQVLL